MAVVPRQRKTGTVYYAVNEWLGKQISEPCGRNKRLAEQRDREMKREIKAGTYQPKSTSKALTFRQYATAWGEARKVASAEDERRWIRLHVLTRPWFADKLIGAIDNGDVIKLIREIQREGKISPKSVGNVHGILHVLFRDAGFEKHCVGNPADIPPDILDRSPSPPARIYEAPEVVALTRNVAIDLPVRVLTALGLLAGLREGEACGLRCRDVDTTTGPLWALDVSKQYGGRKLKTGRPRMVPVHPELHEILSAWLGSGFELWMRRKPTADDFLVPRVGARAKTAHWTRSTLYKGFRKACLAVGVEARSFHATRHTFVSLCRRGGARKDILEKVTHNAKGDIIDRYTHLDWLPLCEAVLCLNLVTRPDLPRSAGILGNSARAESSPSGANSTGLLTSDRSAPCSIPGASTQNQQETSGSRKTRQENRQDSDVTLRSLRDSNRRRERKLLALAEADPDAAAPGLAFCRGVEAAYRGDRPATVQALAEAAAALGLTAGGAHG